MSIHRNPNKSGKKIAFNQLFEQETSSTESSSLSNSTPIESIHQHSYKYIPSWQQWLIKKSTVLKPSACNILIWMVLILGSLILQLIAWKTYWLNNERKFLKSSDVILKCFSEDNMASKYVSKRGKISCKIITSLPASIAHDFVDPPYKLKEIDEINKQPFTGIDGGVYFEFSFIAPEQVDTYTVQSLAYKNIAHDIRVVAEDKIHVIEVSPNDISIDCVGLIDHSYYVNYKEIIVCSISTNSIPASVNIFYKPSSVVINGDINKDIRITKTEQKTLFKFEYTAQCEPSPLLFQVRIKGKNDKDPITVPKPSPLITINMLNEHQVHINCYNPRTNQSIISREELLICRINTIEGIYARVQDFAQPVISVTPQVPFISELKAVGISMNNDGNTSICGQEFEVTLITPSIDVELEIRGHLRSGGTLFADDVVLINMGHVSPSPHELNVKCRGDLSGNEGVALHQETIVCEITSEFEFLKQDFTEYVFKIADGNGNVFGNKVINITSFEGRHHKQGLREETHKEYDIRFEILDDTIMQLELYLVLNDSRIVNENKPIIINTISCPRDGAINCKHWQWGSVSTGGGNILKLLPSTEHYYFSDWKYVTFEGLAHADEFTELILEDNKLPSINESIFNIFPSVRRLSLKNNKFTYLSERLFKGLYSLKELNIADNEIKQIDYTTFDSVLQITKINFENNKLNELPSVFHVLHMLSNLRELNVMNNGLRYIEEEILHMNSIHTITIGGTFDCIPPFLMQDQFVRKINVFPKGIKCNCPAALLKNEICGDWQYLEEKCVQINNDTVKQCHPTLIHNGELATLTALDSLDLHGFEHVGYINISNNDLTVLPNTFLKLFPKLRILDVSNNQISALHSNTFDGLSLNILILDNNNIQSLSPLIFSVSLTYLSIQNNSINSIPSYTLHNLPDLQYINLQNNSLTLLPPDFLQNSMELGDLILSQNKLTHIDQHIFEGKIIGNVDFSWNKISILSSYQFDNIKDIGILDLSYNRITGLPNHLFNPSFSLEGLFQLDFTGNSLYNIAPYFLPNAKNLNFLMMGENYLTKINSHSFANYTNLIELDLHSNSFAKISHEIFPFSSSMIKLNLADNPLLEIEDKTFYKFPSLFYLDLSNGDFKKIDVDDLNGVPLLRELNLENGKLEQLQINQFRHLKSLETLKMSNNRIQSISELHFGADLTKLTKIEIKNNTLSWIGDKSFSNLPNIEHVDISHCDLTSKHISNNAFKDSNIISLQLSYNNLIDLNKQWFDDLTQLKTINLTNNPIKGIKSDTFDNAINLQEIELRNTNILCLPRWLKALGIVVLLNREQQRNCVSCVDKGMWSNGTNMCAPCNEYEICMNDEWDETGTFRLKTHTAGAPPSNDTLQFIDTDNHPNLIGGILSWGEIPDESIQNTQEWVFYLSLDGINKHGATPIISVDVNDGNKYKITEATDVGFNRWLLMYGRKAERDSNEFSAFKFVDSCNICVTNFEFYNQSPRNYHISGEVKFDAPFNQELIANYKIYVGHDPYDINHYIHINPLKKIKVEKQREYKILIEEIHTAGMPYIWIASFFEDGKENNTPTDDVQVIEIVYNTNQANDVTSVARDVMMQS